ncbi:MAG: FG-GAP-like repeat-containing protein [Pirellulaceae bacterium]
MPTQSSRPRLNCRIAKPRFEPLESRRLLAGDRLFEPISLIESIGDADRIQAVGDFDGNGIDDLVVSSGSYNTHSNAWLRLNPETRRFEVAHGLISRADGIRYDVNSAVDMDSDGDSDIVLSADMAAFFAADPINDFYWLENTDGQGTFDAMHQITQQSLGGSISITDVEGDGDWDLFYSGYHNLPYTDHAWYENAGNQEFIYHYLGRDSPVAPPPDFDSYDTDGDGIRFVGPTPLNQVSGQHVDLDGDGDRDILNGWYSESWSENTGPEGDFVQHDLPDTGNRPYISLPHDADRDGDWDLWSYDGFDRLSLLENQGDGTFVVHSLDEPAFGVPKLADLNGDGHHNLITLNAETGILFEYDVQPATFDISVTQYEMPRAETAQQAFDFDNDGDLDLIGRTSWYEQTENLDQWIRHDYPLAEIPFATTALDVNADGNIDLIGAFPLNTTDQLRWVDFTQLDDQQQPRQINIGFAYGVQKLLTDDVNQDGTLDLIVEHTDGTRRWWTNQNGTFELQSSAPYSELLAETCDRCDDLLRAQNVVADIDGDGDNDIVAVHRRTVRWHENVDGQGIVDTVGRQISQTQNVTGITVADFNGDGDFDVAVEVDRSHSQNNTFPELLPAEIDVVIFDNQDGRGTFAEVADNLPLAGRISLAVDLNGDQRAEIVQQPAGDLTGIVIHQNVTPFDYAVGDVNRDGQLSVADIDQLCLARSEQSTDAIFDLDGDQRLTFQDYTVLVEDILQLNYGDANANGTFDSSDLVQVFQQGHYEQATDQPVSWAAGDWNCDGRFDSNDLVVAFQHGQFHAEVQDSFNWLRRVKQT